MTTQDAERLLARQRSYFESGATLPIKARREALRKLCAAIDAFEQPLTEALGRDLGKSASESYMCEIGLVKSELNFMLRHIASFAREKRVRTPLAQSVSRSFEKPSPYGNVLILSPWNYPVLLTLDPLIDAIAAGNTVILKPSAYAPNTAEVLKALIESCFAPEYVALVTGGRAENECLLALDFNFIFFTGSKAVGKQVMRAASERLIPVALELGGKSPCIVDESASISLAARRIVFGKFVNCGQTCVAPDYILCHERVKDRLVCELESQIRAQYGAQPLLNENYGKIVNTKHFARLCELMDEKKIIFGGERDEAALRIAPTLMDGVTFEDPVMGQEIFGPILPILTYSDSERMLRRLQSLPSPLALYIFSSDKHAIARLQERLRFGGGCVNDTLIHLATSGMGFGGVGESGMGAYHGRRGFETFSHIKSIVDKKTFLDLPMRYQPYRKWKDTLIRIFVK